MGNWKWFSAFLAHVQPWAQPQTHRKKILVLSYYFSHISESQAVSSPSITVYHSTQVKGGVGSEKIYSYGIKHSILMQYLNRNFDEK
jgi:hypothetical protein